MSRIGKMPIPIFDGVKVELDGDTIKVEGPKGSLSRKINTSLVEVEIDREKKEIRVKRKDDSRRARAFHGLTRALIFNMVKGVKEGFTKRLEIVGVGYRAELQGNVLNLSLGYSHPVKYPLPEGVKATVERPTSILLESADKELLGQVAAEIRGFKKPEPYKGKGIMYAGERIRRKAGKAAGK